jgi:hypothetical protein
MKIQILFFSILVSAFYAKAQSKKEIISTLNFQMDSLNSEINLCKAKYDAEVISNNNYKESTMIQIKNMDNDLKVAKKQLDSLKKSQAIIEESNQILQQEVKLLKDSLKEKELNQSKKNLNDILTDDFNSFSASELPIVWAIRYNMLPDKYKNTIFTNSDSYNTYEIPNPEKYGVEELIRGFNWYCGDNQKMRDLGEVISINIGYNNKILTYKSGMVYFYYKNQVLKCNDL